MFKNVFESRYVTTLGISAISNPVPTFKVPETTRLPPNTELSTPTDPRVPLEPETKKNVFIPTSEGESMLESVPLNAADPVVKIEPAVVLSKKSSIAGKIELTVTEPFDPVIIEIPLPAIR